jgi:hypothetical protein
MPDLTPLTGCVVGQLALDYRVCLLLASEEPGKSYGHRVHALLVIETAFTLERAGNAEQIDPTAVANYEPTVALLHATIRKALIHPDKSLSIRFSGDQLLTVPRDATFASWELSGKGVDDWVAGPL